MIAPDLLARVPLLPLLIAQGLMVRRKAMILPEPPGARAASIGTGPPLRLLIVGDSSAAGVGAPTQSEALSGRLAGALAPHFTLTWRLEAETGATTGTALAALARVASEPFDLAVLVLGVNDVVRLTPRHRWVARQQALYGLLRQRFAVSRIILSAVPPMGLFTIFPQPLRWVLGRHATRLDRALADLAGQSADMHHVAFDFPPEPRFFARDGYHPGPVAYERWAGILAQRILAA